MGYPMPFLMIKIITDSELSDSEAVLWAKAQQAVNNKNYRLAIAILSTLITRAPGFLKGRKALRACEEKAPQPLLSSEWDYFPYQLIDKLTSAYPDPESIITGIETVFEKDPYCIPANEILYTAAMELNLPELAAFALETICLGEPTSTKHLHMLADHYLRHGQHAEAAETYRRVLKQNSADPVASHGVQYLAAHAAMGRDEQQDSTNPTQN